MDRAWLRVARGDLVRAAVGVLVLIVGMVVASGGDDLQAWINRSAGVILSFGEKIRALIGPLAVVIGGVIAVRSSAKAVRKLSADNLGDARGAGLGLLVSVIGYLLVLITLLSALGVNPAGLLLGGAITGVVLGIAAQQTLGNFFAGIVLLVNRPLVVGEEVVMRAGALGGEFEGLVTDMTLFYVKLQTAQGPVALPNAAVLASAIGPGARAPKEDDKKEESEKEDGEPADPSSGGAPGGANPSAP